MAIWLYGYTTIWLYGCMAVRTYYIIIIIMRVGRSTEKATDDVIGPARKSEETNSNAARVSGPVGPRLLSLATMCYVLFVAISLMLIAPTWSNESTKRPAVDSSTTVAPLGHLCSCSNRSPYHPSLLVWFQFPSLHPTPSPTTLLCTTILTIRAHHSRFQGSPLRHSGALLTERLYLADSSVGG